MTHTHTPETKQAHRHQLWNTGLKCFGFTEHGTLGQSVRSATWKVH